MPSFEEQVSAWAEKAKQRVNLTVRESILGLAVEIIQRSPVGMPETWKGPPPKGYEPGKFKANWQGGDGAINYTITDDVDTTGELSLVSISSKIPEDLDGEEFFITNNLPYAQALENGWSNQAPAGIVNLAMLEWHNIVVAAATRSIVGASITDEQ